MSYPVYCRCCEKIHFGKQIWDSDFSDYICLTCKKELKMKITVMVNKINEDEVFLESCTNEDHVMITLSHSSKKLSSEVSIEELKHALRKIAAK